MPRVTNRRLARLARTHTEESVAEIGSIAAELRAARHRLALLEAVAAAARKRVRGEDGVSLALEQALAALEAG